MESSSFESFFISIAGNTPAIQGLVGGIVIALFNMLGALTVIVWRKPGEKFLNASLGFAAGIMLAASFTSLILPGIAIGGVLPVLAGMVLGALALDLADRLVPHTHIESGPEGPRSTRLGAVWLFIIAITLHNMPEGLAVGVAFGSSDLSNALKIMLAIGIQNIPEGLAVSVAALNAGMGTYFYASLAGIRAGLVEIPLAILGAIAVQFFEPILPYAMGFAAGAMLFVISDEIIPETHRQSKQRLATFGLMFGAIVMLYLDVSLS
ncbi:MAG: ZIP family metal transporter [Chloroflexi bacterium]|nr:ZIP family metal transporter [Chloroflexota bacterium]